MKTVLVTGGAGYIGSHTCKLLARNGYNPVVYDNLSTGHREFVKWGDFIEGELNDGQKIRKTLEIYKPNAVIHFAASAYVGESVLNPLKYYVNNVSGTLSLLEAMIDFNIKNIVFSSTCATYGVPDKKRIDENTHQEPINPYGRSKLMVEKILSDLDAINLINYVALRYFNAAGADPDGEIGELHLPETHLIPLAIQSTGNSNKLKVFGSDFKTADGTAVRDYIHVNDLASAHIKAIEYLDGGAQSTQINLGTGNGTSVQMIIKALENLGIPVNYEYGNRRDGDPAYLVADNEKSSRVLGWSAEYNNIQDIIKTAVNWHRSDTYSKLVNR